MPDSEEEEGSAGPGPGADADADAGAGADHDADNDADHDAGADSPPRQRRFKESRIDIEKRLKECFNLGAQIRPLLPPAEGGGPPLSNPVKKKLGKLMTAMKESIEEARKQSELLATEVSASIDDFHRLRVDCYNFHLLVALILDTDMELLGCIKHVLPRRFNPGVLVLALQELSGLFKLQEPSHPHLLKQHRELVESATELQMAYMQFLLPIVTMIHRLIKPACAQIFAQYCLGLRQVLCDYQKDRALPRMERVRKIGRKLWSLVCAVPEPADETWAAKSGVYAQQLAAIVVEGGRRRAPERPDSDCREHPGEHGNGVSFNDVGAVLLAMIPPVLIVRLKSRVRGDDGFGGRVFGELLMLKKKIEVDRAKVQRKLMIQTWLDSPGLVVEKAKDIGDGKKVPMPKDYRKTEGARGGKRANVSGKPTTSEENKVASTSEENKVTSSSSPSAPDGKQPAETSSNKAEAKKKKKKNNNNNKKKKKKPTGGADDDQVKAQGNDGDGGDLPPGKDV